MTADAFERVLSVTLGHEGNDQFTDDERDPGKETRWGISAAAHPGVDIRNLTRELAAEIYRTSYWQPMHCDEMPLAIALCVFDCAVNMGCKASAKLLQEAVGSNPDGIVGPRTIAAVYRHPVERILRRLNTSRAQRYMDLGGFRTFGRGWLARTIDCAITATEWEHEDA